MDVRLSEDERMLKEQVRRVTEEAAPLSGLLTRSEEDDQKLLDLALSLGWADHQDLTLTQQVVLLQESGRALFPETLHTFLAGRAVATSLQRTVGDLDVVAEANAVSRLGLAHMDPDGGKTRLSLAPQDGIRYLSGVSGFVSSADACDALLLLAFDESAGKPAAVVIDGREAVSISAVRGVGARVSFRISWDQAPVRGSHAAAEIESAYMSGVVLAETSDLAGMLRRILEIGVDHAMNRVQFGRPIGSFQAIQHRLAEAALAVEGAELWAFRIAAMIESRNIYPAYVHAGFSWVRSAAVTVESTVHEVTAGVGFTVEHPLHRFFWRLKARVNSTKSAVDAWVGAPRATSFNGGAFASYAFDRPRVDALVTRR